jgi:hypothetical protein
MISKRRFISTLFTGTDSNDFCYMKFYIGTVYEHTTVYEHHWFFGYRQLFSWGGQIGGISFFFVAFGGQSTSKITLCTEALQ